LRCTDSSFIEVCPRLLWIFRLTIPSRCLDFLFSTLFLLLFMCSMFCSLQAGSTRWSFLARPPRDFFHFAFRCLDWASPRYAPLPILYARIKDLFFPDRQPSSLAIFRGIPSYFFLNFAPFSIVVPASPKTLYSHICEFTSCPFLGLLFRPVSDDDRLQPFHAFFSFSTNENYDFFFPFFLLG